MRIGLEAERANLPNPTGVEYYAVQIIKNLAVLDHTNQYVLYFRTQPQQWFTQLPANFTLRVIPFPKFWTQIRLSWELFWHPVDVLVVLAAALPFYHPKKSVATVHDIAFELFSGIYSGFMNYYQKFFARYAAGHAVNILTPSEATKKDLVRIYHTDPNKITVTPLGLSSEFKPMTYEAVQPVLDKYNLSYKKYILYLGTLQPRKNIIRLIEAYLKLKKEYRIEEKLVIGGGKGWLWEPIMKKINESHSDGVIYLDYVTQDDRAGLYNGASVFCLASNYEGFGLPPLEAMACGTPVVVSNLSSLPEVVGDAGVLVDPSSSDLIAEGLLKVLMDKTLQAQMSAKGVERAKEFTWEKTTKKTLQVIESLNK